ncbi:MAG: hypothetical protein GX892_11885 [Thermoanaerobacteraceae bacterium]|nr:hypothetical protein [Thermoanaerobacteraceae bacterium]
MITDAILSFLYFCIAGLIDLMPSFDVMLPEGPLELLEGVFSCLGYLLPMNVITPIIAYLIARNTFRLFYSVWLVVKSYIPTISGN